VNDLTDDLLDPIVRLLRLLDRLEDIPVLAPAIERENPLAVNQRGKLRACAPIFVKRRAGYPPVGRLPHIAAR
jgi:hypothetical protein